MSFRNNDSSRYGHVPPARYPVANQSQDMSQNVGGARRASFNTGDDAAYLDQPAYRASNNPRASELFMPSAATPPPAVPARPSYGSQTSAIGMAGYQPHYQGQEPPTPTHSHSAYNPQHFAMSPPAAQNPLPYHPAPARYAHQQPTSPDAYSPHQAYNPAAYANAGGYNYNSYTHATQPPAPSNFDPYAPSAAPGEPPYDPAPYDPAPYPPQQQYRRQSYASNGVGPPPSGPAYATATAQMPYPSLAQMPVGPNYSDFNNLDGDPAGQRTSRPNSQTASPLAHSPMAGSPGLQRHPTNAPLPSRPREDSDGFVDGAYGRETQDHLIQDIFNDLDGHRPANGESVRPGHVEHLQRYNSQASTISPATSAGVGLDRNVSSASTVNRNSLGTAYPWDSEESDPEAVAGLIAMQEDFLNNAYSTDAPFQPFPDQQLPPQQPMAPAANLQPPAEEDEKDDGEFGGMDLGMYEGGYAGTLGYGDLGSPTRTAVPPSHDSPRPLPTPGQDAQGPYPAVSVDYGDTGGLLDPKQPRMSFDDGDEQVSLHSQRSGSESPYKEDYPDMFYHPGLSTRPLPALPPSRSNSGAGQPAQPQLVHSSGQTAAYHNYPHSADLRAALGADGQSVERSVSLISHSHTPPVLAPARSRTDATEERRKFMKQYMALQQGPPQQRHGGLEPGTPSSPMVTYDAITLPLGRKRKFDPYKLSTSQMKRCAEPWAMSSLAAWVREMAEDEPDDFRRKTIEEGLVKLFTFKVPTMNVADAEALSAAAVDSMFAAGILVPEEEWVKLGPGEVSGVLWQLTGSGCYAPKLHEREDVAPHLHNGIPVRCYSYHCGRTLKKANLDHMLSEEEVVLDWATFFGLTKHNLAGKSKKEIERQNVLHEIITGEEEFMGQLDVLRMLYRDQLRIYQPPIISANRLDKFLDSVFGKVDSVQRINKEHLLAQLKYRQQEQGPFIIGISDLFREWIRKAKPIYIEYCSSYSHAEYLMRTEVKRNLLFKQFLDQVVQHPRSRRLEWQHFLRTPIARLQRYGLLLETVRKNMTGDSEEKANLNRALDEIKAATHECDSKVDEMKKKVELLELQATLVLRPGFQSVLNLDQAGRELLMQGDLQRQGSKGVRWVDAHVLLFDHYLILAKPDVKDWRNEKKYDVSKEPIPMPLLFLESATDDPVQKQKGLTAPLGARTTAAANSATQLNKVATNGSGDRPLLEHSATTTSIGSRLTTQSNPDILYPFRIKHLGHEVYTLYAATSMDRSAWCQAIVQAKERHAMALHAQNAEPFRLRVLADCAFSLDPAAMMGGRQVGVSIRGTPLDRALRQIDEVYGGHGGRPPRVCRAAVNCAAAFEWNMRSVIAIGTDFGVFTSDATNPRGWQRSVQINKVTQIAVLEEFSICILLADRALISYPLDTIALMSTLSGGAGGGPGGGSGSVAHEGSARRAPQRLAKDVSYFSTARMKDRMLLFYKRREGMHSTFRVLEPVFHRAAEKKSRSLGIGRRLLSAAGGGGWSATESFRDFDEFYLPTECYSLNTFQSYIAIATAKGFELLTLDKKQPASIPSDLAQPTVANIASRIRDQRPLGMFKLNDQEFLLTYEDCAVYVDKHGEISRTLIMEYSGKQKRARGATMFGGYLLLFNEDYVEVRNAENGRLRQIIAGRDVRCLDYGFKGPTGGVNGVAAGAGDGSPPPGAGSGEPDSRTTVKICMNHPEIAGGQVVLEMLLNDGHTEK